MYSIFKLPISLKITEKIISGDESLSNQKLVMTQRDDRR